MSTRILIVEDNRDVQMFYKDLLIGLEIVCAFTVEEARQAFMDNSNFAAIVMDACVPGDEPTTPPLVRDFRKTFKGPMIATSSDDGYNNELMAAGCDYKSFKYNLHQTLLQILHDKTLLPHFK